MLQIKQATMPKIPNECSKNHLVQFSSNYYCFYCLRCLKKFNEIFE